MIKSAASKVMWVGRATVFLVGLAVILALVFGVASTVSAHTGNKGFFHLGHKNVASAVSTLVKQGPGPALSLMVKAGQPPLEVNSDKKVAKLNADKLDNLDQSAFLRSTGKAADSDKLDGKDSTALLPGGDLPSGRTVRGNFYILSWASAGSQEFGQGISFGYRLPSTPTGHYIKAGEPVPAGCSGNATNPEAAPGHLCVFEDTASNVTTRDVILRSRQGSGLYIKSAVEGHTYAYGTWAVTGN